MKLIMTIIVVLLNLSTIAQGIMTTKSWEEQSKIVKALLPKYGTDEKTEREKKADEKFIKTMMNYALFRGERRIASDYFIKQGWSFLRKGHFETAMFRFNQAYLLDSTNGDIYWGYGGFFYKIGYYEKAKEQYEEGLKLDPENTNLLTDFGSYYLNQYYVSQSSDKEYAFAQLENGIKYLLKSYELNSGNPKTLFNLSVCFFNMGDCKNAWRYHDEYNALNEKDMPAKYTRDLKRKCKIRKNKN